MWSDTKKKQFPGGLSFIPACVCAFFVCAVVFSLDLPARHLSGSPAAPCSYTAQSRTSLPAPANSICTHAKGWTALPACSTVKNLTEIYTIDDTLGQGSYCLARGLTHKTTGLSLVGRFQYVRYGAVTPCVRNSIMDIKMAATMCDLPGFMQLKDAVCYEGEPVSVWSRCSGVPMATFFQKNACPDFSRHEVVWIMRQLLQAVVDMRRLGVMHRDLTFGNVFLDKAAGRLCIIDYNLAHWWDAGYDVGHARAVTENVVFKMITVFDRIHRDDAFAVASVFARLLSLPGVYHGDYKIMGWDAKTRLLPLMGAAGFREFAAANKIPKSTKFLEPKGNETIPEQRVDWRSMGNECNAGLLTDSALSLLNGLMQWSYFDRRDFIDSLHIHNMTIL